MDEKIANFLLSIMDETFAPYRHDNRTMERAAARGLVRRWSWYPVWPLDFPFCHPYEVTQEGMDWIESYTDPKTKAPELREQVPFEDVDWT